MHRLYTLIVYSLRSLLLRCRLDRINHCCVWCACV